MAVLDGGEISKIYLQNSDTQYSFKDTVARANSIEYIVGTQTASTNLWTGVTTDSSLETGKIIAYKLPYAGTSTAATLNLTLSTGSTTGEIELRRGNSTVTTQFVVNSIIVLIYDGTYWRVSAYYDTNTTYTPQKLGFGYGTCTTASATTAKVATLASYSLITNGMVAIKFTYAVPAGATLNINSKGAKAIYHAGSAITEGVIGAGDTALFVYDGSHYNYVAKDLATGGGAVDSVNGQTGTVVLDASDVGALADSTTFVSSFNGSTGAITYTAPVTSVNGSTGAVTVSVPTATSDLTNDSGYISGVSWGDITGTLSDQADLQEELDDKANQSEVATIESSSTASTSYSAGDYLVYGGSLYKVTTAISSGETLTVGTNIEATTVGDELIALNDDLNEYETFTGSVGNVAQTFYRKRLGNLYIMFGSGAVNAPVGAGATSQRAISYYNKPFTTVFGGACNLSMAGLTTSHACYASVGVNSIDCYVYNPSGATINNVIYSFIVIGK